MMFNPLAKKQLVSTLNRDSPKGVVSEVKAGKNIVTFAFAFLAEEEDVEFRTELIREGLLDTILDYVEKSPSHTFKETLPKETGDLECPSSWTNVLYKFTLPNALRDESALEAAQVKIAQRIYPMIRCMCDLGKREYFKRRDFWYRNSLSFVGLILNLFENERAKTIVLEEDAATGDNRLLKFLVQVLFIDLYRLDVQDEFEQFQTKNLGNHVDSMLHSIQRDASHALRLFCDTSGSEEDDDIPEDRKDALFALGDLPAVDPDYEGSDAAKSGKDVNFATGLLQIAARTDVNTFHDDPALQSLLWCSFQLGLVMNKDEFGLDAPKYLVRIGLNKALHYTQGDESAFLDTIMVTICELARCMKSAQIPYWDDTAIAGMISEGLFEFLLKVLYETERRWSHPSATLVWDEATDILEGVEVLLGNGTAMARQSFAALEQRAPSIHAEIESVQKKLEQTSFKEELENIRQMVLKAVPSVSGSNKRTISPGQQQQQQQSSIDTKKMKIANGESN